ncbi:hypothetical protein [Acidiferrobacter sp.]|uniref:hypothetical protein n=1 Tax=Acidiferrobacter sp. TaxID=1872107 RepID=UPI002629EB09|nr:hypothetical protein [Acidiferrobacter sp.]
MDEEYRPIPCALQDRYERAIITGRPLAVGWSSHDRYVTDRVHVIALETADGAEYVRFTDSHGAIHRLRLDHIRLQDDA